MLGAVNCTGDEKKLQECSYAGPGQDNGCTFQDKSAGVLCFDGQGLIF